MAYKKLADSIEVSLDKKLAFAKEYFENGFDSVAAYIQIYSGNEAAARFKSKQLLSDYEVRRVLDRLSMEAMRDVEDEIPRIALELRTSAYLDPIHLFTPEGDLKPLNQIPEAARRAIAGLEVSAIFDSEGNAIGHNKKLKLRDKEKSLKLLGEWQKMYTQKVEVGVNEDMAKLILDARKRYLSGKASPEEGIIEGEIVSSPADIFSVEDFLE